jgi:hypothetical protein
LVTAFDTGVPEISTSAIVTITINRNQNSPVFTASRYEDTVYDYIGVGSNVLQITATDADVTSPENSVIYDLQDNSGFFTIHPFNGMITVDRRLTEDTTRRTVYVVCKKNCCHPREQHLMFCNTLPLLFLNYFAVLIFVNL